MNKGTGCEPRAVTAAVSVETVSDDENQSLGNREGRVRTRKEIILHKREPEDLQTTLAFDMLRTERAQEYGLWQFAIACFYIYAFKAVLRRGHINQSAQPHSMTAR